MNGKGRTPQEIRQHYLVERELAARLRSAGPAQRRQLYGLVYDELFRRVPSHPQLTTKVDPDARRREAARQLRILEPYLGDEATLMELGAGDLAVARAVSERVRRVYAIEVSDELTAGLDLPSNVDLVISDGVNIDVPDGSVSIAFSHQLLEHLHPDDAGEQLADVHRVLAPGGVYICLTPNRLSGPHDVSKYFDEVASGFHLKEYTVGELTSLFREVGFGKVHALIGGRGSYMRWPTLPVRAYEQTLAAIPVRVRRALVRTLPFRALLGVGVVGAKTGGQRLRRR